MDKEVGYNMPYINGQFVDKNQLGAQTQGLSPDTGMANAGTSGSVGGLNLQRLLGLMELSKGNATGAWSIMKPPVTETAEMKNRRAALKPALTFTQKALAEKYENTGPIALPEKLSIKYLGGLGARQSLVRQQQTFSLLKQNVVRALQGAKMSDTDIELAGEYIPDVADTPDTIQTKLEGLDGFLRSLMELPQRPSLSSFED